MFQVISESRLHVYTTYAPYSYSHISQTVARLQLPRRLARHPHPDMHLSFQMLLSFISLLRVRPRGFDFFFASTPRYRVHSCAYNFLTGGIFSTQRIAAGNSACFVQLSCKSTGHGVRRPRGANLKPRADHMQLLLQEMQGSYGLPTHPHSHLRSRARFCTVNP